MFFKNLDKELFKQLDSLKDSIDCLKRENAILSDTISSYEEIISGEMTKAEFSVDFVKMNAFSIERVREGSSHKTIIGYLSSEPFETTENGTVYRDNIREWSLSCSLEVHQRLVSEFNAYKGSK